MQDRPRERCWAHPGRRRKSRHRCRRRTRGTHTVAPCDVDTVDTPTLIAATVVAGHSPTKSAQGLKAWHIHHRCNVATRAATPRLAADDRTTTIGGDCAV